MKTAAALRLERMPGMISLDAIAEMIRNSQQPDGSIPWSSGDKTDPWDHVESAMGLCIAGDIDSAVKAFQWLQDNQLPQGAWYAAYRNEAPEDRTLDANMTSYIAVGLYHYHLITGDRELLDHMWPTLTSAIAFTLSLQAPSGEIYWAISPEGGVDRTALLTGSSSIYMSLKCAAAIAQVLNRPQPLWPAAAERLAAAIRYGRHRFDQSKARFSMDWFYPVLAGAIAGEAARRRIDAHWNKFVIDGKGVRCVSDEPWITIAETSELCLTLAAIGDTRRAERVFDWMVAHRYDDGTYWCGFTVPDGTIWPEEHVTWTNAVVLMAADALYRLTPAGRMFHHNYWNRNTHLPR